MYAELFWKNINSSTTNQWHPVWKPWNFLWIIGSHLEQEFKILWLNLICTLGRRQFWIVLSSFHRVICVRIIIITIVPYFYQEYKDEIAAMALERDNLIVDGEALMKGSSETRACDIDYKINKLKDRWQQLNEMAAKRWEGFTKNLRWLNLGYTKYCLIITQNIKVCITTKFCTYYDMKISVNIG